MTTGEPADQRAARDEHEEAPRRGERINVGGGDDAVTRMQLAARWAEAYSRPPDSLAAVLKRFRAAYEYLDAVTHGVEPPELEGQLADARAMVAPAAAPVSSPPREAPSEPHPQPIVQPQPEPRPWG